MSTKRLVALVLLVAGIAGLAFSIAQGPQAFQYLVVPPDMPGESQAQQAPNQGHDAEEGEQPAQEAAKPPKLSDLRQLMKQLDTRMGDLSTAQAGYGMTTYAARQTLNTPEQGSAIASVQGLWGDVSLTQRYVLSNGRQLYLEELQSGAPSAVIDERLAIDLFRVGDPIGRKLTLGSASFTVVGVVRHSRHPGEADAGLMQVPLLSLDKQGAKAQVLAINVQPKAGSGAYAALSKELEQLRQGGSFHSLMKERYRALLPLRWLLCGAGLLVAALGFRVARAFTRGHWHTMQRKLQSRYAARLLPEMIGRAALVALMYGVLLAGVFLVLQEAIAPVYVFPEWVPTVLVEPKDISKAFWGLREQQSVLVALHTPELWRLRFLHRLMTAACVGVALLIVSPLTRFRLWLGERLKAL